MNIFKKITWLCLGAIFIPFVAAFFMWGVYAFRPSCGFASEEILLIGWIALLCVTIFLSIIIRKKNKTFSNGLLISIAIALVASCINLFMEIQSYKKLNILKAEKENLTLKNEALKEQIADYKKKIKAYEEKHNSNQEGQ